MTTTMTMTMTMTKNSSLRAPQGGARQSYNNFIIND